MKSDHVSIKEHFTVRLAALEKAADVESKQLEKRLQIMNEFREQLKTQANTFLTKEHFESKHELIQNQVDELRINRTMLEGKASQRSVLISYVFSGFAMLLSLLLILLHFIG